MKALLADELRKILLLSELRNQLNNCSTQELKAVERFLKSAKGKNRAGRPAAYSDPLLNDVESRVHQEMARLKSMGEKRAGPKTAIRSLVEKHVSENLDAAASAKVRTKADETGLSKIDETVSSLFKKYEAARKRG